MAKLYATVAVDPENPEDLARFTRKGGIFKPLSEEEIDKALSHPNYKIFVIKDDNGDILTMASVLLPPSEDQNQDTIFTDTLYDKNYRDKLHPHLAQGIQNNVHTIGWIQDVISDPNTRPLNGMKILGPYQRNV